MVKSGKPKKDRKSNINDSQGKKKVIRDSFTIPENDYRLIKTLIQRCLDLGLHAKKSELLRAGLYALNGMSDKSLSQVIENIEKVKTGRPAKSDSDELTTE